MIGLAAEKADPGCGGRGAGGGETVRGGKESGGLEVPAVPGQSTVGRWCEAGVGEEEMRNSVLF